MTDITLEILEKRLHMTPSEIKRLSRESDLLGKTTELEKKLLLLESHALLSNIPTDEKPDICSDSAFQMHIFRAGVRRECAGAAVIFR